jgi:hypothetical protein
MNEGCLPGYAPLQIPRALRHTTSSRLVLRTNSPNRLLKIVLIKLKPKIERSLVARARMTLKHQASSQLSSFGGLKHSFPYPPL